MFFQKYELLEKRVMLKDKGCLSSLTSSDNQIMFLGGWTMLNILQSEMIHIEQLDRYLEENTGSCNKCCPI